METREVAEAEARHFQARALKAYEQAKTSKARNQAADDAEYWGGRVAMLSVEGGWA